ncbi:MAG: aminoglycoside phosphotransferase family protein [Bacteroidales bacterium]|nr:aminoglycoside phosphotransferase family protein [Bacteroidales bacterium]
MKDLNEIVSHFNIEGTVKEISPLGAGLINDTYKVLTNEKETDDYVLQRINHIIFQDVELMQNNIQRVTDQIRKKLKERGETDIKRKTLTIIPAKDGKLYYFDGSSYWRITILIKNSKSYEAVTPEFSYYTGKAFGDFQNMLVDIPGKPLGATIPNFHNMEFRLEQFKDAIKDNKAGRLEKVQWIVDELMNRADEMCKAERLNREGKLPKRITHCDTKVNNMLFDATTDDFLCVIDLDTTMPGYVLSDFGDFMRTAGNTAAEDETDLTKISLNMDIFKSFTKGYVESAKPFLERIEIENLPYGAKLLTYMQTVRFLTDYLNGDVYYKIKSAEHNWERTLAQFTLLKSIEEKEPQMMEFIDQMLASN